MTKLARILTCYKQFGFVTAIRFILCEVARKILDPYGINSYSQTGEDRIIAAVVHEQPHGFFVDVGCNHPQRFSNTFELYKRGWRGLNIDANLGLVRKFNRLRPRDISVCAVVSDKEGEVYFTDFAEPLVSSLDEGHVADWKASVPIKQRRLVRTVTLTALLAANHVARSFDLLSIDVEGHDFEVLRSLDLTVYRPRLIVIEMHHADLSEVFSGKIYRHLARNGYKMVGYAVMNGYFVDARR
jgi:FkbM family methyltransferase